MGMNAAINLKHMELKAKSINERGKNFFKMINGIYDTVGKMQPYWQGESYVNFANSVIKLQGTFERLVFYYCARLPYVIIKKRNQYAKADQKREIPIPDYCQYGGNKGMGVFMTEIVIKDQGDELIYNAAAMDAKRDKIDQLFDNILKTNLPNIKQDFNSITWRGTTGDTVRKNFNERIDKTIDSVKKIRASLRKCLEAQGNAMNAAEEGNAKTTEDVDISDMGTVANIVEDIASKLGGQNYDPYE